MHGLSSGVATLHCALDVFGQLAVSVVVPLALVGTDVEDVPHHFGGLTIKLLGALSSGLVGRGIRSTGRAALTDAARSRWCLIRRRSLALGRCHHWLVSLFKC